MLTMKYSWRPGWHEKRGRHLVKVGSIDAFDVASEYYQNEVFKSIRHAVYT